MVRLLSEILMSPFTGSARLFGFVVKNVNEQVEAEYLDEGKVQAELLDLTLRYDGGELNDEQYKEQEARILQRLNDIRNYKQSAAAVQDDTVDAGQAYDDTYDTYDAGETNEE